MICPNCKKRWAHQREDDFVEIPDKLELVPRNERAKILYHMEYDSNERRNCGCVQMAKDFVAIFNTRTIVI
ncbi:MAG: hypothetical protein HYW78_02575 [Parcubacteria group bacterium]|nr:hypothetical protein [Parcubacteria group bacterium]